MNEHEDESLDRLLGGDFLTVPQDFPARVMQRIDVRRGVQPGAQPGPRSAADEGLGSPRAGASPSRLMLLLRWLTMIGGGALALSELLGFMFGLWSVTHAF